jgi:hypothetical protein
MATVGMPAVADGEFNFANHEDEIRAADIRSAAPAIDLIALAY